MSDPLREEERESRWEAAPAVALVIALQVLLALVSRNQHWKLWDLPWWVWLIPVVPELALLVPLAWRRPRQKLEQMGHRRTVSLTLLALISLANALLLLAVVASLVRGDENSGAQLLLKAGIVWGTNAISTYSPSGSASGSAARCHSAFVRSSLPRTCALSSKIGADARVVGSLLIEVNVTDGPVPLKRDTGPPKEVNLRRFR